MLIIFIKYKYLISIVIIKYYLIIELVYRVRMGLIILRMGKGKLLKSLIKIVGEVGRSILKYVFE